MEQSEATSQPIGTGRRGRFGKTAETRGKAYLPVWWDPLVLGKILIAVGILRARGKYRAGLSDGVALVPPARDGTGSLGTSRTMSWPRHSGGLGLRIRG